jgi:hypothetical protein
LATLLLFQEIDQDRKQQSRKSDKVKRAAPTIFESDPAAEKERQPATHSNAGCVNRLHARAFLWRKVVAQQRKGGGTESRFTNTNHHTTQKQRPKPIRKSSQTGE